MSDAAVGKTFVGTIYVRPCARGVCLVTDGEWTDLEDWIAEIVGADQWTGGGEYRRARITVERLPDDVGAEDHGAAATTGADGRGEEGAR